MSKKTYQKHEAQGIQDSLEDEVGFDWISKGVPVVMLIIAVICYLLAKFVWKIK
jgi:hypothetical protein